MPVIQEAKTEGELELLASRNAQRIADFAGERVECRFAEAMVKT
jgi:hypothetical protein